MMISHQIYSNLKGIKSAQFFGCCLNSISIDLSCTFEVLDKYIFDSEYADWYGDGVGFGVGNSFGDGDGVGNSGDEPVDFSRDHGNGIMSQCFITCNLDFMKREIKEQELFFIERSFDD